MLNRFKIIFALCIVLFSFSACQKEPDPTLSANEGMKKMIDVKREAFELTFAGINKTDKTTDEFNISFVGKSDSEDKADSKFDASIGLKFKIEGKDNDLALDTRLINKNLYLKLSKFTVTDVPSDAMGQLMNKWWEVPVDTESKDSYSKKITDELGKVMQVIKDTDLFANVQKVSEEEIKGIMCRKYQADVKKEGLQKILESMPNMSTGVPLTDSEKAAIASSVNNMSFRGYVWVGKDDETIHKLTGTLRFTEDNGNITNVDLNGTFWDFGKDIVVEKPVDATPFNPALLFGLAGEFMSQPSNEVLPPPSGGPIDQPLGAGQVKK